MAKRCVQVYPRFERFWHWAQALLITVLLFSGLGMNGVHTLLSFDAAVRLHTVAALALFALWVFATFWLFTTGTWKQFVPKLEGMVQVARFYAWGIFRGEPHPYRKIYWRKHNPLQAATYFGLKWLIFPAVWLTGFAYLSYNLWAGEVADGTLWITVIANIHLLAAYLVAAFVIVHVYLLTVGHGFLSHVRPMVTGYDTIDLTQEQEAYLRTNEPYRIREIC
ncbi:cytochrome b/b6 domain-containing protein [Afifella pfennigii]|uniref:cytochrome b/b6 domain-containing protein n=1 Tax=Afifella pfennigii TaxID=209897 RepID=UPI00047AEAE6|nr:cytochrome b/b6 domain-containing protein [Afifella pfennigii]